MAAGKKRGASAPRPRSGFATEEMRHTERLTVRVAPEVERAARALVEERGITFASIFEAGVRAVLGSSSAVRPIDVPCAKCGAKPGQPCKPQVDGGPYDPNKALLPTHRIRVQTVATEAPTASGTKPALQTQRKRLYRLAKDAGIDLDAEDREEA